MEVIAIRKAVGYAFVRHGKWYTVTLGSFHKGVVARLGDGERGGKVQPFQEQGKPCISRPVAVSARKRIPRVDIPIKTKGSVY